MVHVLRLVVPSFLIVAACGTSVADDSADAGGTSSGGRDGSVVGGGSSGDASASGDAMAPTVVASNPANAAADVSSNVSPSITFSEPMAPASLNATTFLLTQGDAEIEGSFTYAGSTLTFVPTAPLALGATFAASIGTGATDVAGNALAASHSWTFTTSATGGGAHGPPAVALGSTSHFAILAEAAISSVTPAVISGDVGISPAAATYITGITMTNAGTAWTAPEVTGSIYAANNDAPTPAMLTTAVLDLQSAYADAAQRTEPTFVNLGDGQIGGMTLTPGLYVWPAAVTMTTDVILSGGANDTWVFQVHGDLGVGASAAMTLQGGARANNVYWQSSGAVVLAANAHAEGTIMAATTIDLAAHASVTGRLFSQTAVHLVMATVTAP